MKLYVLINSELPLVHKAVQAGHAIAAFHKQHPEEAKDWDNEYLIYLDCPDLDKFMDMMDYSSMKYSKFHEPDRNHMLTAVVNYSDGKLFKKLKLIS